MATVVVGDSKVPFSIPTEPRCRVGRDSFPWIAPLYPYLIMLSVKQGSIKYHMTRPRIEPTSPESLANTLTIMPMSGGFVFFFLVGSKSQNKYFKS